MLWNIIVGWRGLYAIDGEEIQGDMSRRSPNDVDESDPEERAMLDAENDMLAADLDFLESTGALAEGAQQEEVRGARARGQVGRSGMGGGARALEDPRASVRAQMRPC